MASACIATTLLSNANLCLLHMLGIVLIFLMLGSQLSAETSTFPNEKPIFYFIITLSYIKRSVFRVPVYPLGSH